MKPHLLPVLASLFLVIGSVYAQSVGLLAEIPFGRARAGLFGDAGGRHD
jgi:hypothetical protein